MGLGDDPQIIAARTCVLAGMREYMRETEVSCAEAIETDQREDLCAVLLRAGALRGFHDADDDVTEQWRDW